MKNKEDNSEDFCRDFVQEFSLYIQVIPNTKLVLQGRKFSSLLFTITTTKGFYSPPPLLSKSGLKLDFNVNIVYENLNSQYYAQKPQQNCMFMNLASGLTSMYCTSFLSVNFLSCTAKEYLTRSKVSQVNTIFQLE